MLTGWLTVATDMLTSSVPVEGEAVRNVKRLQALKAIQTDIG